MIIPKIHREFYKLDLDSGWVIPDGYPDGIVQKIISGSLDEIKKTGSRTRILKIHKGVFTTEPFVHDYWEEVFLFEGDLRVGNNEYGEGGETFTPLTYAVRPPGTPHGPFSTTNGCTVMEIHYYDEENGR